MWLEWLKDEETTLSLDDEESVRRLLDLYESAVKQDYRYYKVCRNYCKFVLKFFYMGHPAVPAQTVRDVHEFIL